MTKKQFMITMSILYGILIFIVGMTVNSYDCKKLLDRGIEQNLTVKEVYKEMFPKIYENVYEEYRKERK